MADAPAFPGRVEICRIAGDIYINGVKKCFAVDFNNPPTEQSTYEQVDWLLGWAKVGLISAGHVVPHFPVKAHEEFDTQALPPEPTT